MRNELRRSSSIKRNPRSRSSLLPIIKYQKMSQIQKPLRSPEKNKTSLFGLSQFSTERGERKKLTAQFQGFKPARINTDRKDSVISNSGQRLSKASLTHS